MLEMTIQHAHECARFLKHLRRTGNVVLAAEAVGVPFQRFHHRRRRFADFAVDWAAALAFAQSRLAKQGATDLPDGAKAVNLACDTIGVSNGAIYLRRTGVPVDGWTDEVPDGMPLERMTLDQALTVLTLHRKTVRKGNIRIAHNSKWPTREETNAALTRQIAAAGLRLARKARGEE